MRIADQLRAYCEERDWQSLKPEDMIEIAEKGEAELQARLGELRGRLKEAESNLEKFHQYAFVQHGRGETGDEFQTFAEWEGGAALPDEEDRKAYLKKWRSTFGKEAAGARGRYALHLMGPAEFREKADEYEELQARCRELAKAGPLLDKAAADEMNELLGRLHVLETVLLL